MSTQHKYMTPKAINMKYINSKNSFMDGCNITRRYKDQEKKNYMEYQTASEDEFKRFFLGVWNVE